MDNLLEDIKETLAMMIDLAKAEEIARDKTKYQEIKKSALLIYKQEYQDLVNLEKGIYRIVSEKPKISILDENGDIQVKLIPF